MDGRSNADCFEHGHIISQRTNTGKRKLRCCTLYGNNESVPITLDLRENGFILNSVSLPFPVRASELIKILGEPRIAGNQSMENVRAIYCKEYKQECILKNGGIRGAVPLGNLHLNVSRYGREISEKAVRVMELCLNHDVKLEFFE